MTIYRHKLRLVAIMKSACVIIVLLSSLIVVKGCPYLAGEDTTHSEATHPLADPNQEETHMAPPRTRRTSRRLKTSFRDRIRKFLNLFDFLNLIPNPAPPKSPTKAPVVLTSAPVRAPVPVAAPTPVTPAAVPVAAPTPVTAPVAVPVAAPIVAPIAAPARGGPTMAQVVAAARTEIGDLLRLEANAALGAKFVRLSFHDCVGGCDGCVDLSNLDNTGLNLPIVALTPIVTKYEPAGLTRADVWALAGLTAAGNAQGTATASIPFPLTLVGRPVCANLPNGNPATRAGPNRPMPSAHFTSQQLLDFFATTFAFNANETVAIMGAHTLGRAVPANSGFNGGAGWGPNTTTLDNDFYQTLLLNGRVSTDLSPELQNNSAQNNTRQFPNQFLWRINRGFMLNVDMALAVNLAGFLDAVTGAVNCSLLLNGTMPDGGPVRPTCPNAPNLLRTAVNYGRNNTVWVTDFRDAFVKMINTGCNATTCSVV